MININKNNFETFLAENSDICDHHLNIQTLMTEAYRIENNFAPPIMETMLERKAIPHNSRTQQEFVTQRNRTVNYGLE